MTSQKSINELRNDFLQLTKDYMLRQSELNRDFLNRGFDLVSISQQPKSTVDLMKNTSDMISLYAKNLEMLQKMFPTSVSDEDVFESS